MSEQVAIAGRYRVLCTLGEGGMATVYEVADPAGDRSIALKRLRAQHVESEDRRRSLFEQEFHILSQLRHPRIVEVFDYGVDELGEYYTMELVDGSDLHGLSPLPWRQVCAYLSDVCSALSMLHSRRLVFRDLSAHNVRCTRDGKAKLIDFGAMAPFGVSPHVVGTPTSTAPEALFAQVLDARTDLFALGATAYYALTGRHPYPAYSFAALHDAWRSTPPPPSRFVAELPRELDELVLSLVQLSPMARPRSAAEVIERLCAIAELTLDEQLVVSRACLTTPMLVAREESLSRARRLLWRLQRGGAGGRAVLIGGPAGIGRSRFLDACVLHAKLLGARVVRVDASDGPQARFAGALALLEGLRELEPGAGEPPESLCALSTDVRADQGELQQALLQHVLGHCERAPLVIAIDDLPRLDRASAASFALLADAAPRHRLLLFATAETTEREAHGPALALFDKAATVLSLPPLTPDQSESLLGSVVGDVPNLSRVADRLHAIAAGNPGALMSLAQHLLDRGLLRYEAGSWVLPRELDAGDLPTSLSEALAARVRALGSGARQLAAAIALSDGDGLSLEACRALFPERGAAAALRDLDELVVAEVVALAGERYVLTRPSYREVLTTELGAAETRDLRLRLCELLAAAGLHMRAARHAMLGGADERALDLVLALVEHHGGVISDPDTVTELLDSLPEDWALTVERSLHACRELGRPRLQYLIVLRFLLSMSAVAGRPPSECFGEILTELRAASGLDDYAALADECPEPEERLRRALEAAQRRFEATPAAARGWAPADAIPTLARIVLAGMSSSVHGFDLSFMATLPSLAPLAPLAPALRVVDAMVVATRCVIAGRLERGRAGMLDVLSSLEARDSGVDRLAWQYLHQGALYCLGTIDAQLGLPEAERWIDQLERAPISLFAISAHRLRRIHALQLGDFAAAETHRRSVERLEVKLGLPQALRDNRLWQEFRCYAAVEDLVCVKQLLPELERVAEAEAGWSPIVRLARAHYHRLRGDAAGAVGELADVHATLRAGEHVAWPLAAGSYVDALRACGRAHDAVAVGRELLAQAERAEIGYLRHYIFEALALAEAAIGEHAAAREHAEQAIALHAELAASGVTRGAAHEVRARVAIAERDEAAFERHAAACAEQYRAGQGPALTAKYERLMRLAREARLGVAPEVASALGRMSSTPAELKGRIETLLSQCEGPRERAERILGWLGECGGYQGGFLYTLGSDGLQLVAHDCARRPPEHLSDRVEEHVSLELGDDSGQTVTEALDFAVPLTLEAAEPLEVGWLGGDGDSFAPLMLRHETPHGYSLTGVAVMCLSKRATQAPPEDVLGAVSKALEDFGDAAGRLGD